MEEDDSVADFIELHPIFIFGFVLFCIAAGSFLSQTLFTMISAYVGISVLLASIVWISLALVIITIGFSRSVF